MHVLAKAEAKEGKLDAAMSTATEAAKIYKEFSLGSLGPIGPLKG